MNWHCFFLSFFFSWEYHTCPAHLPPAVVPASVVVCLLVCLWSVHVRFVRLVVGVHVCLLDVWRSTVIVVVVV